MARKWDHLPDDAIYPPTGETMGSVRKTSRERSKDWYENNKDRVRDRLYQKSYGITLDDYNALSESQNHVCAICETNKGKRRMAVDHCHDTGKIRGLLCKDCNTGIGNLNDDPNLLHKALEYLNAHRNLE